MSTKQTVTTKRVIATLDNDTSLFLYNTNVDATLPETLILAGKPEPKVTDKGSQYRFSHAESGWFASINADDEERLSAVLQLKTDDIVIRAKALVTYQERDLKGAKPFTKAKAK